MEIDQEQPPTIDPTTDGENINQVEPSSYLPNQPTGLPTRIRMNWRSPIAMGIVALCLALVVAGCAFVGLNYRQQSSVSSTPVAAKPQAIVIRPTTAPTPTTITALPSQSNALLFQNPTAPAYVPGSGFNPDAQRILDITTLQIGLEKYRTANGSYPPDLASIFPSFAPVENGTKLSAPPVDPVTHKPYAYTVSSGGTSYQLSATLSNGKQYTVTRSTP